MRGSNLLPAVILFQTVSVLALLTFTKPAFATWVEWIVEPAISFNHKENINNAFIKSDEKDDNIITPAFTFGRIYQVADFTRASLTTELMYDSHQDFTDLSHLTAGAAISIKHKFGIGRELPWIQSIASASILDFRGDRWDSNLYALNLSLGKRLHDRVDATITYKYEIRDGKTSPSTFDHKGHTGAIGMNLLLTEKMLLSLKYSIRKGDIAAVCSPQSFDLIEDLANDVQFDNTFENGWCLYRIDAVTQAYGANLSYAFFGGHYSSSLGYERMNGDITRFTYSTDAVWVSIDYSY